MLTAGAFYGPGCVAFELREKFMGLESSDLSTSELRIV